jgi:hypothetical protein
MAHLGLLTPSLFEPYENIEKKSIVEKKKKKTSKTEQERKMMKQAMMNEIHSVSNDGGESMAEYVPQDNSGDENNFKNTTNDNHVSDDSVIDNIESYNNLQSNSLTDYYKATSPPKKNDVSKDELLQKLDHILHLLNEQKDEKTGHVTEEVVLYSFIGIFIIFVCDSFARAGKYVR